MADRIHPTAVIEDGAELGADVQIGPFCTIGAGVRLGDGCRLMSHVVLSGETTIGSGNRFFPFATVGVEPQDLKFKGEGTRLEIGSGNTFRESCTVHVGTDGGGGVTRIGNDNFLMAYAHIAHDCQLGDGIIMANAATLAGHVTIMDRAMVGAFSGVHQFCRVGREAFVGGYSVITQDAMPYILTVGNRATSHGINTLGLKRRGVPAETLTALRNAYRAIFRSKLGRQEGLAQARQEWGDVPHVDELIRFITESERGVVV
ncbi:MAG: acyl-ACP--UDP-N-acetylglucosamine O-acyltransferase [Acidobacteria bacterium]|nr:MAG: acyl-ACP--UDP-N-acetylglucosamine O-acyltransferase [Acidobacteriota bacterium]